MSTTPRYRRIMSGEAGVWAAPVQAGLWFASKAYGVVVRLRNQRYDNGDVQVRRLPVPVISVGNLTTGGTGKTPLVIALVERLRQGGWRPAVVSRGYRSGGGRPADELALVEQRVGGIITVANPDRVAGGATALERGADIIVLDDAYQHRRIHRDLNIIVLDSTCPFGYGHLLPRGLLRESASGLSRADLIVLSRTDLVESAQLAWIAREVRSHNSTAPILKSVHRIAGLTTLGGKPASFPSLEGRKVLCVSGVGNPGAFIQSVKQAGAEPVDAVVLADHASYDRKVFGRLSELASQHPQAELLVTTEKDLVKLSSPPWSSFALPIVALAIDIDFGADDDRMLDDAIRQLRTAGDSELQCVKDAIPTDQPG
ncbi:MAG: tetraacyldisaccharide 4'-kinase [bacterium]|nr:tetraacyldisaccharide 4'-kinase [bacterium]